MSSRWRSSTGPTGSLGRLHLCRRVLEACVADLPGILLCLQVQRERQHFFLPDWTSLKEALSLNPYIDDLQLVALLPHFLQL